MPNFGSNIAAMLDAVNSERDALEARLEVLREREKTLKAWQKEEAQQGHTADLLGAADSNGGSTPLGSFLRGLMADGRPRTSAEIGELAAKRGLIEGEAAPGRVVHYALMGLSQHGVVERDKEAGTWKKAAR
jgi:hypothetical protein